MATLKYKTKDGEYKPLAIMSPSSKIERFEKDEDGNIVLEQGDNVFTVEDIGGVSKIEYSNKQTPPALTITQDGEVINFQTTVGCMFFLLSDNILKHCYTDPFNSNPNSDSLEPAQTWMINRSLVYLSKGVMPIIATNQGALVGTVSMIDGDLCLSWYNYYDNLVYHWNPNLQTLTTEPFCKGVASSDNIGGIKTGYTENGKNYPVELDDNNNAFVNVPWTDTNTDTKVTSADNHYTPSGSAKTGTASGSTLGFGGAVVTGLTYDSKGHVTGFTTSKLPSNPNTDTKYTAGTGLSLSGTTFSADGSAIINALSEGTSAATADDYIVAQYAGGGTTNTSYYRRKLSNIFKALTKSDITNALGYTPPNTNTTYSAGSGITLSGTTFSHADTSALSGTYGPSANVTGSNGATIVVPQITVDGYGHVTGITNRTYTSVNTDTNTDTKNTAGSTNSTSKLYLIGAASQAANPQTYSNSACYMQSGYIYATSDERLKNFENDIPIDFNALKSIPKKYFRWKSDPEQLNIGTSAQALQKVYPELVTTGDVTGEMGVNYQHLSVVALAAIDKLHEENLELKERIEKLEKLLNVE